MSTKPGEQPDVSPCIESLEMGMLINNFTECDLLYYHYAIEQEYQNVGQQLNDEELHPEDVDLNVEFVGAELGALHVVPADVGPRLGVGIADPHHPVQIKF